MCTKITTDFLNIEKNYYSVQFPKKSHLNQQNLSIPSKERSIKKSVLVRTIIRAPFFVASSLGWPATDTCSLTKNNADESGTREKKAHQQQFNLKFVFSLH